MALLFFLAEDNKTRVKFDSEASVEVSLPSKVTQSSVMSGQTVSDDVIEGNIIISVTGNVTYSKLPSQTNNPNPIQIQEYIQEARRSRRRFTVFTRDNGQPLLQDYEDCVIKDASVVADRFEDAITVSITFEQVFIAEAARKTFLAPKRKEDVKPSTSDTTDSGQGTKTNVDENESTSIFYKMFGGSTVRVSN